MYQSAQPLFLICETALHAGTGSDTSIIDLPIQRERHTGFPKVESSGLKGALRQAFETTEKINKVDIHRVFGFDAASANETAKENIPEKEREFTGALTLTDARLLLFPVKSQKGIFAWVTCNRVLSKFFQEMSEMAKCTTFDSIGTLVEGSVGVNSSMFLDPTKKIIGLEEYQFNDCNGNQEVTTLGTALATMLFGSNAKLTYWADKIKKDIVVLSDEDFADFVSHSTEIVTRTKINNETGTVSDTALFTEEYLPAESIMYSMVFFAPEFRKDGMSSIEVAKFYNDNLPTIFQLGGNATIGKGIVRTNKKI